MRKFLFIFLAGLSVQTSFAFSDVKPGKYVGSTAKGEECRVQIDPKNLSVWYKQNGHPWTGISLPRSNANEQLNAGVYSAKGSTDGERMSLSANVTEDGTVVNATFGIGVIFLTKVECLNMKIKAE